VVGLAKSGLFDFWPRFGSVIPTYRDSLTEASPKIKNPRCTPLHHFYQRSKIYLPWLTHLISEDSMKIRARIEPKGVRDMKTRRTYFAKMTSEVNQPTI